VVGRYSALCVPLRGGVPRLAGVAARRVWLSLPKMSSVQVRRHAGIRGGCRRGGRVCTRLGGRRCP
jgi:hypothetical protein